MTVRNTYRGMQSRVQDDAQCVEKARQHQVVVSEQIQARLRSGMDKYIGHV